MLIQVLWNAAILSVIYIIFVAVACYKPRNIPESEWKKANPPFPSDKMENLFWFVQVSDTHISKFLDPKRAPDFQRFCADNLKIIDPEVVLVTGDLTDAKHRDRYGSEQYIEEWIAYNRVLKDTNVTQRYVWIDIRGNHDAFDILTKNDPKNYYMKYSGDKGRLSSSTWNLVKSFGKYSFIPVDATMTPGPKRPFNFIGHLSKPKLDKLYKEGEASIHSNMSIWYGHYPTSSITSASVFGLRSIIGQFGDVYLSGHYHNGQGIIPRMYAMHSNGFLELEVGDFMKNRRYRVVAVDHDLLSFADVSLDDWPIILITNPKPATYMTPKHEPIKRMQHSTHIRFLAFSDSRIDKVSVSIDGKKLENPRHVEGALWVCKWNPDLYKNGMHHLVVSVQDENGQKKASISDFSLDTEWSNDFDWLAVFILLTNICTSVQLIFIILTTSTLALIIYIKRYGVRLSSSNHIVHGLLFQLQCLLSDDTSFYVIFLFTLNLLIGPQFVGELLTGHVGICFAYGLLIDGELYSEYLLYVFGIIKILVYYVPVMLYLSYCADLRWQRKYRFVDCFWPMTLRSMMHNSVVVVHVLLQCMWLRSLYLSYGIMALMLSPSQLWWNIASLCLLCRIWMSRPHVSRRAT